MRRKRNSLGWYFGGWNWIRNINKYYSFYVPKGFVELVEDEYFQAVFKLGPVKGPVKGPVEGPVDLPELHISILKECKTAPKSRDEILSGLNIGVSGYIKRVFKQLIEKEYLEYTIPEKPASRLQKYRITAKGQELIQ